MGYCEELYLEISDAIVEIVASLISERVLRIFERSLEFSEEGDLPVDVKTALQDSRLDLRSLLHAGQSLMVNRVLEKLALGGRSFTAKEMQALASRITGTPGSSDVWKNIYDSGALEARDSLMRAVDEYVPKTMHNRRIGLLKQELQSTLDSALSEYREILGSLNCPGSLFGGDKDLREDVGHAAFKLSVREMFNKALKEGKFRIPYGYGTLELREIQEREVVVNGERIVAPARTKLSYREGTRVLEELKPSPRLLEDVE